MFLQTRFRLTGFLQTSFETEAQANSEIAYFFSNQSHKESNIRDGNGHDN